MEREPAKAKRTDKIRRERDGSYPWKVLQKRLVPNVPKEVERKLMNTPLALDLENAAPSEEVAEEWRRRTRCVAEWKASFVKARDAWLKARKETEEEEAAACESA